MDVPQGHPHDADPRAFLEGVRPQIRAKLEEEIKTLNRIKFQLALKVQLRKDNPDGSEEYTDPVLCHKQEAILQNSEIEGALTIAHFLSGLPMFRLPFLEARTRPYFQWRPMAI